MESKLECKFDIKNMGKDKALRPRYLIGLPSKEVAKKMGKSDGAVRVMLTRSLTRLNEMLTG
jgi:DNA-directed RNA polymerase specialized sigma24 family protein